MQFHNTDIQKGHSSIINLSSNPVRRKEEKDFILELKARNEALLLDQKRLQSRLKSASISIKKYKQELESLSRRRRGAALSRLDERSKMYSSGCHLSVLQHTRTTGSEDNYDDQPKKTADEIAQLKDELSLAHKQIKILKSNTLLLNHGLDDNIDNSHRSNLEFDYKALVIASNEQIYLQEEMRSKLDVCNSSIRNLQEKIKVLENANTRHENETETMEELVQENKMLHEKISKLCQLPFLEEHSAESRTNMAIDKLNKEIEELESKIKYYTEQVHVLSLDNRELRQSLQEMEFRFRELLQERDILIVEVGKAKEESQVENHKIQQVLKRNDCSIQTDLDNHVTYAAINEGLHSSDVEKLKCTINDLSLVERFQYEKIKLLQSSEFKNISDNLIMSLEPDETILRLTIEEAILVNLERSTDSRSFVVVDLFDFESKASNIVLGGHPKYNYSLSFKLKVNAYLLSQMEQNDSWIEVYSVRNEQIMLYGRSNIGIQDLLKKQECKKQLTLLSDQNHDVGSIHIHFDLFQRIPILT